MKKIKEREKKLSLEKSIMEAYKHRYEIIAWDSTRGQIIKAVLTIKTIKLNQKKIVLIPSDHSRIYLEEMMGGYGRLNFIIPEMSLVFESEYLSYEGHLTIGYPKFHKFFDRRRSERVDPCLPIKVRIEGQSFFKECFDISVGGFSVVMGVSERILLNVGELYTNVGLDFSSKSYKVDAEVVSIMKIEPYSNMAINYKSIKISFKFTATNHPIKKEILRLINGQRQLLADLGSD